jgi:hypothetical protein
MASVSAASLDPSLTRVVGIPNDAVNTWGIGRKERGKWERLYYPDASGTHIKEWPLSELSLDTVRDRWGSGEFRVYWFGHYPEAETAEERWVNGGSGTAFVLEAAPPTRIGAPAAAPPVSSMDEAAKWLAMIQGSVQSNLSGVVQLAAAIGAKKDDGGMNMTVLTLLLEKQQMQFNQVLERMANDTARERQEMRRELTRMREMFDESDVEEATDGAVKRAVSLVKPGKPIGDALKTAVANWFIEDPGLAIKQVLEISKAVPGAVDKLREQATAAAAQQQAAAAAANRPRPVARLHGEVPSAPTYQPPIREEPQPLDPNAGFRAAAGPGNGAA